MVRKQMTTLEALVRLQARGITIRAHPAPITQGLLYRVIIIPETIHMGLKDWAAFDRIRRDAPVTYLFEGR